MDGIKELNCSKAMQGGEPAVIWLAGLHNPETYIAAMVQTACRAYGWPLDTASLFTQARQPTV